MRSKRLALALCLVLAPIAAVAGPPQKPPPAAPRPVRPSVFATEQRMSFAQRMNRWNPLIATASKRFGIPASWLRAVMQLESGGRTMLAENRPIVSSMGAMGLMQLMPETWRTMRAQLGLGNDPYDPRDNIFAAAAYLSWLKSRYGYPNMFAAYNDGPRNLEARLFDASLLPRETRNYLARITGRLDGTTDVPRPPKLVRFTQPDGTPLWIDVGTSPDVSVREAAPGEYPPGVRSVVTVGRRSHGVWENVVMAQYRIASHGRTAGGPGAQAASLD